jgi:cephalosporin hydroxylase
MFLRDEFEAKKIQNALAQSGDAALQRQARAFMIESDKYDYGYQWTWLGLPFIQMPADIVATQEIIWASKPDVIIETGIAWGGSVVFYASLLQLIGKGRVVAVDLNLYDHVVAQIMAYPFADRIQLHKGSSTDADLVARIKAQIASDQSVMVLLDSNHTHQHVLDELRLYAPLVTRDQYLIVSDTFLEDIPAQAHRRRPWGPGNNPKTAVRQFLAECERFEIDQMIDRRLLLSYTWEGYLKCVAD